MKQIPVSEFKVKCLSVISQLAETGEPVILTRRGKVVAKLFPATETSRKKLGKMPGNLRDDLVGPIVQPEEWAGSI